MGVRLKSGLGCLGFTPRKGCEMPPVWSPACVQCGTDYDPTEEGASRCPVCLRCWKCAPVAKSTENVEGYCEDCL